MPAAISGTDVWRTGRRWRVAVGAPIELDDLRAEEGEASVREATDRLWRAILTLEAGLASDGVAA